MMYASLSRLHQGCLLLSGFAELQKKIASHSEIRCITHYAQQEERTSCATALYDLSIFWRETDP